MIAIESAISVKVPPSIVHKDEEKDVFLYNGRAELPICIDKRAVDELLSKDELKILEGCYVEITVDENSCEKKIYCYKQIPFYISKQNLSGNEKLQSFVDKHYVISKINNEKYELNNTKILENEIEDVKHLLNNRLICENDKYRVSKLLEKHEFHSDNKVFHANVFNHANHSYFYAKRHEHVPGIMLMEIARQAFYAHFYKFNNHKKEDVNLSILRFDCTFDNYVQSNYALIVSVETTSLEREGLKRERHALKTTFRQNNGIVAVIEMIGTVVSSKLFKKLRDIKPQENHLFEPINTNKKVQVLLFNINNKTFIKTHLKAIAKQEIFTKLTHEDCDEIKSEYFLTIYTEVNSYIEMFVTKKSNILKSEITQYEITNATEDALRKLREFIKMDCIHTNSINL